MLLTMFVYVQCALLSLRTSVRRQPGQGLVEYALIIGLIAVVLIAVLVTLRGSITGIFQRTGNALNGA